MDRVTEERIAENQSRFRDANERIRDVASLQGIDVLVPFICECADTDCVEIVRVDLSGYAAVRKHPRRFLTAPGHERASDGVARVVSEQDGYVAVEKIGHAGEVAERLAEGVARATTEPAEER